MEQRLDLISEFLPIVEKKFPVQPEFIIVKRKISYYDFYKRYNGQGD